MRPDDINKSVESIDYDSISHNTFHGSLLASFLKNIAFIYIY